MAPSLHHDFDTELVNVDENAFGELYDDSAHGASLDNRSCKAFHFARRDSNALPEAQGK